MKLKTFPKLYFVTSEIPETCETLNPWIHIIKEAVLGGVGMVQIRDKHCTSKKMIEVAQTIHPFLQEKGVPLIINDRVEVALAVKAEGIHLGQSDVSIQNARRILGSDAIIGLSVETLSQMHDTISEEVSYLAASPVFSTNTKLDHAAPWGLDGLKALCKQSPHPIIGIGGIDIHNSAKVMASGARGIAVISAISKAPCPQTAAKRLYATL